MIDFAPSRLKLGRLRRGFTGKQLAEQIEVSAQAITAFESGNRRPSPETVGAIASVLHFPSDFFFDNELELIDSKAASFRSRRSMTSRLRNKAVGSGTLAAEIVSPEIRQRFVLCKLDVPDLAGEDPKHSADILRDYWKLGAGPIKNVVHLLESKGIEVYWLNDSSPLVDAFSFWHENRPFVVLNSNKPAGDRGRYDAAHELGHLVLHRTIDAVGDNETEREANIFAASFLLPEEQFRVESPRYPVLEHFFPLKQRWGVSISAMARRSRDVGVFTEWDYIRACKQISQNGWRSSEPISIEREESRLHAMIFERLAEKHCFPSDLARKLRLQPEDLLELMPTAREYEGGRVRRIPKADGSSGYLRLL